MSFQKSVKINLLFQTKQSHLQFLKSEVSFKQLEQQLSSSIVQQKIQILKTQIESSIYYDVYNAFWFHQQYTVTLTYVKNFD